MRIKYLLVVAVVIAVGVPLLQLFAADSEVLISKETTYISGPLAEDGLPNYALAIIESQREGVTRENNGARLFWQAIGPVSVDPDQFDLLCDELGVDDATAEYLVDVASEETVGRLAKWLEQRESNDQPGESEAGATPEELTEQARELLNNVSAQPWTSAQLPPVAEWLAENEAVLDLLVEASSKPRFYSPPPNVLADPNTPVFEMLLPHAQEARSAVRSLSARAMNRVAERHHEDAWQDILACWRFGVHIGKGPVIVEKLVGMAFRNVAKNCTIALLQADGLTEELASRILNDLHSQPNAVGIGESLDQAERLSFLDNALRQVTDRLGGIVGEDGEKISFAAPAVDPNATLRIGNHWYDRLVKAAAISDMQGRRKAVLEVEADLEQLAEGIKSKTISAFFSRTKRSEMIGEILVSLMLPATSAAIRAEDRDSTSMTLVRLAAALAVHRARAGEYPASLDDLIPAVLAEVPLDPYNNQPLVYERRENGYLLYSVFENEADDGGTDFSGAIADGEWAPQGERAAANLDQSDLVIRSPSPALELPGVASEERPTE